MLRIVRHVLAGLIVSLAASALAVAAGPSRSAAQRPESPPPAKVFPRDDSASDPTFLTFKNRLLAAAKRGDIAALRASMAETLNAGFETATRDQVIAAEGLREGQPWQELVDALELGTTREGNGDGGHYFMAPYVSSYTNDLDGYEELAIIGRRVRLRRGPHPQAEVLDEVLSLDSPASWAAVRTGDGTVGYVFARYVRSPIDVRFFFEKVNGRWLLTMLAAGD